MPNCGSSSSSFNAFLLMKGWRTWRRVGFLSNDLDPESILLLHYPVHSTMSSVQRLRFRPRLLLPGVHPWINSFSTPDFPVFVSCVRNNPVSMIKSLNAKPKIGVQLHSLRHCSTKPGTAQRRPILITRNR